MSRYIRPWTANLSLEETSPLLRRSERLTPQKETASPLRYQSESSESDMYTLPHYLDLDKQPRHESATAIDQLPPPPEPLVSGHSALLPGPRPAVRAPSSSSSRSLNFLSPVQLTPPSTGLHQKRMPDDVQYNEKGEVITLGMVYNKIANLEEMLLAWRAEAAAGAVAGPSTSKPKEVPEVQPTGGERKAVRIAYSKGEESARQLSWKHGPGFRLESAENVQMNEYIEGAVKTTHPNIHPQALQIAMQAHYTTRSTRASKAAKPGRLEKDAVYQRRQMRKHTKSIRRVSAAKSKHKMSAEERRKAVRAMSSIDLMSSDDSAQEDGNVVFLNRTRPWESLALREMKILVDKKADKMDTKKAAEMRKKRRVGPASDRAVPVKVASDFPWALDA